MNKRDFLKNSLLFGLGCITQKGVFASNIMPSNYENNEPRIVFIFLRGGVDGLSILAPHSDAVYYEKRPKIALPADKGLKISSEFSINPILKESFFNLYKDNQAIFIPSSGQDHDSRSHFLSEDFLFYGANKAKYPTGFLNRLAEVTNLSGVCFTNSLQSIFKGEVAIPTMSLDEISFYNTIQQDKIIQQGYSKDKALYKEYLNLLAAKEVLLKINDANDTNFDQNVRFKRFAKYMDLANNNIGFIELNEWDTHIDQHPLDSKFSDLIENLNSSIIAFKENTTEKNWERTAIVIFSEFGRTVKENGALGTEHGHGNLMAILGGLVNKSKILGEWDSLSESHRPEGRCF